MIHHWRAILVGRFDMRFLSVFLSSPREDSHRKIHITWCHNLLMIFAQFCLCSRSGLWVKTSEKKHALYQTTVRTEHHSYVLTVLLLIWTHISPFTCALTIFVLRAGTILSILSFLWRKIFMARPSNVISRQFERRNQQVIYYIILFYIR